MDKNGAFRLTGGVKGTLDQLSNTSTSPLLGALNSFISSNNPIVANKPKAYLNWILLDEQFQYVSSYPQSGALAVGNYASNVLNTLAYTGIPITKNGYLYIYVNNETPGWDVFFDNMSVKHYSGAITEETHYYPFGLTMAGISSKAAGIIENKRKFNKGSEVQNKEFSDGSGLELYATQFRSLDPQLGRWWQIDPKPDYSQSLYSAMNNNPISINDPLGDTARIHFRSGFLGLGKKHTVDYNNGKLTNTDGSAYAGKVTGFLKHAVNGLNRLSSGGSNGKALVNDIVSSTQTTNIMKGSNGFNAKDKETGMTNVVRWDPSNTSGGPDENLNTDRPAFIGLGHELAHAQDQISDGQIDYNEWYTPTGTKTPVANAEKYATHVENLLRVENGLNLRAFYSVDLSTGIPRGEGQVLIPGTRTNANFPTVSGVYWDDEPDGPSPIPFVYHK